MRKELENINRIEAYLNIELTSSQKEAFENELKSNAELQELLEQVKAFRTAVFRAELRKKIESNATSGGGYGKILIIGITVLIIGLLSWFYSGENEVIINNNYGVVIQNDTTNSILNQSDETDSNEVANNQIKEELTIPAKQEQAINHILGGHKLWIEPKIQNFSFSNEKGATIEGEDGMLVIIPENAFVNKDGNPVKGNVEFKLLEAFGISEMVLYNLKTVSNGSPLESGGMFYLEASLNGTPLRVNPKRPLYIEIPTVEKKEGMMAFNGESNRQGEINWVNPKPLEKYLVKVPFKDLDFLPEGFENEVHSVMPFFNHSRATSELVDSLYYSFGFRLTNDGDEIYSEAEKEVSVSYKPNLIGMDSVVVDVFVLEGSEAEMKDVKDVVEVEPCGIDPLSIKTIKTKSFENTFIATKEFESRLHYLHKAPNGQELLYI